MIYIRSRFGYLTLLWDNPEILITLFKLLLFISGLYLVHVFIYDNTNVESKNWVCSKVHC